jgi:hypothetical protein
MEDADFPVPDGRDTRRRVSLEWLTVYRISRKAGRPPHAAPRNMGFAVGDASSMSPYSAS